MQLYAQLQFGKAFSTAAMTVAANHLEEGDYYITGIAESAAEAMAMVAAQMPAIVLLDIFWPPSAIR